MDGQDFGDHDPQGIEEEAEDPQGVQEVADPDEDSPVARADGFIQTSDWGNLEQFLVNIMPTCQNGSHPALLHPFPFLTVWRRRVMDLLAGGQYGEAAQIFATKIHPLKNAVTARISSEKLHDEIGKIERSVGSKMSVYHAHCGPVLMKKLISDYLRFYLPNSIGYVSPKGKQSAMWEFAVRLDPPVLGVYKSHADIRCLLCSEQEYTNCNIGVKMEGHLPDCPGLTPEASRRFSEALKKRSKRKRSGVNNISSLALSKILKVTTGVDPLPMIYQKVEVGIGILNGMTEIQQDADVTLGLNAVKSILGDISELVTSALQRQAAAVSQVPQAPQAPAPPVDANALLQALLHAQVQAPPAPHPTAAAGQVPLQAPPGPHPAAGLLQAPAQVQLQAPQAPHPAAAVLQVPPQAPPAPHPAAGLLQAPAQVQLQAPQAPHLAAGLHPAAAVPQVPLANYEDEQDYYEVFADPGFLPDLPDLDD